MAWNELVDESNFDQFGLLCHILPHCHTSARNSLLPQNSLPRLRVCFHFERHVDLMRDERMKEMEAAATYLRKAPEMVLGGLASQNLRC